jgi:hypothetical protein
VPTEWSGIPIIDLAKQGWTYQKRTDEARALLLELMNPENEGNEEDFSTDDVPTENPNVPKIGIDEYGTIEASGISPGRLPDARKYAIRAAKILSHAPLRPCLSGLT